MRKQLLAMASSAAIVAATLVTGAGSAGAIQIAPNAGPAADSNFDLVQFQNRGQGGFSGNAGARSGGRSGGFSGSAGVRSSRGPSANFSARGFARGPSGPAIRSGNVRTQNFQARNFRTQNLRAQNFDRRSFARVDGRRDGKQWDGDRNRRHVVFRGHRHRFLGAVIIGVPFGYAAVSSNPCYDWVYGPQGWGYYWNYDRCPV